MVPPGIRMAAAAGSLGWWLNATLAGTVPADLATDHLTGQVLLPGNPSPQPWLLTVAELRRSGAESIDLRLVEAGDPLGLPGPAAVTSAVVAAGTAVLAPGLVLIPDPAGRADALWRGLAATPQPITAAPLGTLSEARSLMRTAMAELSATVNSNDPDEAALAAIAALRGFAPVAPPPGIEPTAAQVADSALRVWWLTTIASELAEREGAPVPEGLRQLRPLARRAASVAFSEPAG